MTLHPDDLDAAMKELIDQAHDNALLAIAAVAERMAGRIGPRVTGTEALLALARAIRSETTSN